MATMKKKAAARKAAPANRKTAAKKKTAAPKQKRTRAVAVVRRPPVNPPIEIENASDVIDYLNDAKSELENFAAHLRARDRKRLNGVGVKKRGFVGLSYDLAFQNPEFLPPWLTLARFNDDIEIFDTLRSIYGLTTQVQELTWNLVMISADMAYTDSLEYYSLVREAAKRRVDAAEAIFAQMRSFFRHGKGINAATTEAELMRDARSVAKGHKDGKVIIENTSPKLIAGKRKIVDETFKSDKRFKEYENGEIIE